jgi:hypothetical protein
MCTSAVAEMLVQKQRCYCQAMRFQLCSLCRASHATSCDAASYASLPCGLMQLWQAITSLPNLLHLTTRQLTAMGLHKQMRPVICKRAAGSKGRTLANAHAWTAVVHPRYTVCAGASSVQEDSIHWVVSLISPEASVNVPTSFAEVLTVHRLQLELCADLLARKPAAMQRLLCSLCRRDRRKLDIHETLHNVDKNVWHTESALSCADLLWWPHARLSTALQVADNYSSTLQQVALQYNEQHLGVFVDVQVGHHAVLAALLLDVAGNLLRPVWLGLPADAQGRR